MIVVSRLCYNRGSISLKEFELLAFYGDGLLPRAERGLHVAPKQAEQKEDSAA
jgi:hypothetical protein